MMDSAQITGPLRVLLAAGGPLGAWLLAHGMSEKNLDSLTLFLCGGIPLLMAGWSWWSNRRAALVKKASAVPGVDPLRINADASPALAKMALDPKTPAVQPQRGAEAALRQIANG